jgi:hypothetical protein
VDEKKMIWEEFEGCESDRSAHTEDGGNRTPPEEKEEKWEESKEEERNGGRKYSGWEEQKSVNEGPREGFGLEAAAAVGSSSPNSGADEEGNRSNSVDMRVNERQRRKKEEENEVDCDGEREAEEWAMKAIKWQAIKYNSPERENKVLADLAIANQIGHPTF